MKFIEIHDGFSVNIKDIVAIERVDQDPDGMASTVYIRGIGPRGSTFPYLSLLQIVHNQQDGNIEKTLNEMNKTMKFNSQRFEG